MLVLDQDTGDRAVFGFGTKVGINIGNNTTPLEELTVSGNISANGRFTTESLHVSSTNNGILSAGRDLADIFATSSGNITGVTAGTGLNDGGSSGGNVTLNVDAAQTGITSILATDLKVGEDDQTKIDFETADEIHFYANNTEQVYVGDNIFGPQSDSDVDLGADAVRWKDAYVDKITAGDITIDSSTISDGGSMCLDAGGDIRLDAAGNDVCLLAGGTAFGSLRKDGSDNFLVKSLGDDKDIIFKGVDDGSDITALTLDMSDAGTATFNNKVCLGDEKLVLNGTAVTATGTELNYSDGVCFNVQTQLQALSTNKLAFRS